MWRVRGLSRISLSYNVLPLFSADASIYVSFSPSYLLLVVDGEVTDFKTDPVTGLRSLTLPSGTYSIVGTENLTPEMREKYAAYLPGKAADRESFESPNTG